MMLTYYEYINENRGISNFIKKLSTIISGKLFKEYEKTSDTSDTSDFNLMHSLNYEINHQKIIRQTPDTSKL